MRPDYIQEGKFYRITECKCKVKKDKPAHRHKDAIATFKGWTTTDNWDYNKKFSVPYYNRHEVCINPIVIYANEDYYKELKTNASLESWIRRNQ